MGAGASQLRTPADSPATARHDPTHAKHLQAPAPRARRRPDPSQCSFAQMPLVLRARQLCYLYRVLTKRLETNW